MILTICPNTALDKVIRIKEWTPGIPMRTNQWTTCVGGKGLNSSVVLRQIGVDTVALGFFAGKTGEELIDLLKTYGVVPEPVWVDGYNRISYVIAEEKTQIHNHVIVGEVEINQTQQREFVQKFSQHIQQAAWVVFAGSLSPSLPNDFYVELIGIAKDANVPTLIDSQKQYLLEAIKAEPGIVKLNREEFEWTFNRQVADLDDLIKQAREIRAEKRLEAFVITLAKDGILAFTPQGDYLIEVPLQNAVNAAGAGDAVSSALVWRLSLGDKWKIALQWSGAVSAATVLTERTGDVVMADVERIFPDVTITEI